jgi:Coenzyme PQQ synthesis protein D (PqqD)
MSSPAGSGQTPPIKSSHVSDELLADGSMVLFHASTRRLLTLNPTAALVWEYCDGSHSPAAIAAAVSAVFPDVPAVSDDVERILLDLREQGMLGHESGD